MDAYSLTEEIKPYAVEIAKQSNGGCQKAKNVITFHQMLHSCPGDNAALVFCNEAFKEWKSLQVKNDN